MLKSISMTLFIVIIHSEMRAENQVYHDPWASTSCLLLDVEKRTFIARNTELALDGIFVEKGNQLILKSTNGSWNIFCQKANPQNVFFKNGLRCRSADSKNDWRQYVQRASAIPVGSLADMNANKVVYLGKTTATSKTALKVRAQPTVNAKAMIFRVMKSEYETCGIFPFTSERDRARYTTKDSMTAGYKFYAHARTASKAKVGTSENYWYYVVVQDGCPGSVEGWRFGGFIELSDEVPEDICAP